MLGGVRGAARVAGGSPDSEPGLSGRSPPACLHGAQHMGYLCLCAEEYSTCRVKAAHRIPTSAPKHVQSVRILHNNFASRGAKIEGPAVCEHLPADARWPIMPSKLAENPQLWWDHAGWKEWNIKELYVECWKLWDQFVRGSCFKILLCFLRDLDAFFQTNP